MGEPTGAADAGLRTTYVPRPWSGDPAARPSSPDPRFDLVAEDSMDLAGKLSV